ncbi:MAG: hypothetical protein Q9227_008792 [Pyrenula ochraceoflavens]
MAGRQPKQTPLERRRGELALSDFADYVERQQAKRANPVERVASVPPSDSGYSTSQSTITEDHAELDIIDQLGLADAPNPVRLKDWLLDTSEDSGATLQQLTGLVQSRIDEGHGETLFELGQEDNGDSMSFNVEDWNIALDRLAQSAASLKADTRVLLTYNVGGPVEASTEKSKMKDCQGKVLIRQAPPTVEDVIETRIAVVGNVDAGKSTMLGVLVKGNLDDGRGKARVNLFRHKHEIESGRTSSVGMEIMGFDTRGNIVASNVPGRKLSWEEIGNRAAKVISFTDLAGHERYLRTTVFGLLSSSPNYCLLMVAANNGLIGMSKEHLGIAISLNVPVMVVITKIDICPPQILEQTISQLTKILKSPGARKIPIFVKTREDTVQTATQFVSQRICPIFQVSNVTGESLDLVRTFLNILPHHGDYDAQAPFEFHINDTFSVPFVGTVVSGVVKSGVIHAGDSVLVGPDGLGQFTNTTIRSIERKRISVPVCSAGQSASFALKKMRRKDVRKGMVVLPKLDTPPKVHREFVAEVLILSHATTIKTKYQAMLHVGPVSQTCAIIDLDREFIRTGDRAMVAFRFVQRPEYLATGDRILFREGRTKGLGIVKQVGYDHQKPLRSTENAVPEADVRENGKAKMRFSAELFLRLLALGLTSSFVDSTPQSGKNGSAAEATASREYFYVGGRYIEYTDKVYPSYPGYIVQDQMYVEKLTSTASCRKPYPIVFIHGLAQTATNWLNKPDGSPGWASYFLSQGYDVYLLDIPVRGRSPDGPPDVKTNITNLLGLTTTTYISKVFTAIQNYRLWPQAITHTQWPGTGMMGDPFFDAFYSAQFPSLADAVVQENLTRIAGVQLLDRIALPVILVAHSASGSVPWLLADARPDLVKTIVGLEPAGPPFFDIFPAPAGSARQYGVTDLPMTYDPPQVGNLTTTILPPPAGSKDLIQNCTIQKEPAKKLVNLEKIPVLIVTSEARLVLFSDSIFLSITLSFWNQLVSDPSLTVIMPSMTGAPQPTCNRQE